MNESHLDWDTKSVGLQLHEVLAVGQSTVDSQAIDDDGLVTSDIHLFDRLNDERHLPCDAFFILHSLAPFELVRS